jgi:hypothetical protein
MISLFIAGPTINIIMGSLGVFAFPFVGALLLGVMSTPSSGQMKVIGLFLALVYFVILWLLNAMVMKDIENKQKPTYTLINCGLYFLSALISYNL